MRLTDSDGLRRFDGLRPPNRTWVATVVGLSLVGIAVLDGVIAPDAPVAHLYYLPILLAGVKLGRRPAIAVALLSVVLFHVVDPEIARFHYGEADIMELALFVVVALVSSRLAEQARELHRLATTDDLTGLHNLRSFEAGVRRELETVATRGQVMAIVALDVDRLKQINDAHGHLAGADAVRQVGLVIAQHVPARGIACRYGGDEFVIFLPRCDEAEALLFAETLCASVHGAAPQLAGTTFEPGTLSVSIGVATGAAVGAANSAQLAERMFRRADGAMYEAKAGGRGRVVVWPGVAP